MKAVRRINNNVIICLDENGNEVIARGKGIGYHDFPYEVELKDIERTYYNIDRQYFGMINDIPEEIIDISTQIIDHAREVIGTLDDSNIVFTLADHINFAIKRYKENVPLKLPIIHDIQYLFKEEYEIGIYGLELVKKELGIYLPKDEAAYIALHIHEIIANNIQNASNEEEVIARITEMIERSMGLKVNKEDFNYSRFVSHMHYLLRRKNEQQITVPGNDIIYEKLIEEYPDIYAASEEIADYLEDNGYFKLNADEKMYLMLHINRLCAREHRNTGHNNQQIEQ